jgi:glycine/D-amino acid oxidase-like deaminating enzyme
VARLRLGSSIWLEPDRPHIPLDAPRLDTHLTSDVVIVGGGLTGAVIADACVERGLSVAVLEAGRLGRGSTGANTGLLVYEPDALLSTLASRYGVESAVQIWRLCRAATTELIDTLRRRRITCELERRSSLYFSTTRTAATRLRADYELRREQNVGGRWLDAHALRQRAWVAGTGAIESRGHAQLDPYQACLGLLAASARRGARLFERSRVTRVDTDRTYVRVRTPHGSVRASHVIVATGYATREFRPLAGSFALTHTYAMSTGPLSKAARARLGVPDLLLWSAAQPYHYLRWGPGGRLIVGGADHPLVPEARRVATFARGRARLARQVRALCPGLRGVPFEQAWEGLFAVTPDGLPYLGPHRRYPRHLFALGYGGNGMAFAGIAARLLTRALEGRPTPELSLFSFSRFEADGA